MEKVLGKVLDFFLAGPRTKEYRLLPMAILPRRPARKDMSHQENGARPRKKASTDRAQARGGGDTCFVICPFGGWHDRYYTEVYRPAVEGVGLSPRRADDLYRPSAIVHDIWDYVKKSRVMLAELTGKNPNVFYELGLAHAVGKPVVLVSQSMEDVPFDLRSLRVITYDVEDPEWSALLRKRIEQSLTEVLASPEQAVLPTFLHEHKVEKQPTVSPLERKVLELQKQVELLRVETRPSGRYGGAIDREEAELLLNRYLRSGMPRRMIVERLVRMGAPERWVVGEIDDRTRETETLPFRRAAVVPKPESNVAPPSPGSSEEPKPKPE